MPTTGAARAVGTDGAVVSVGAVANVAVIVTAEFAARLHAAVPLHPPPLHPENVDPVDGVADSVTRVLLTYGSEQSAPQVMPVGVLDGSSPAPAFATVTVNDPAGLAHASLE